jgi:hypothetical protein
MLHILQYNVHNATGYLRQFYDIPAHPPLLLLLRSQHQLRADMLLKVLFTEGLELHRALLERNALLVCVLGDLGRHVVPDDRVQAGNKHQTGASQFTTGT